MGIDLVVWLAGVIAAAPGASLHVKSLCALGDRLSLAGGSVRRPVAHMDAARHGDSPRA